MIRGHKLLELLKDKQVVQIGERKEKRIGMILVVSQLAISVLCVSFAFSFFEEIDPNSNLYLLVFNAIIFIVTMCTQLSMPTLIAYKSFLVFQEFENIFALNITKNLEIVYNFVQKIHESIQRFDSYVSIYALIYLLFNLLISVSSLCHLAINPNVRVKQNIICLTFSISLLLSQCLVCDVVPKSLRKLIDRIEREKSSKGFDSYNPNERQIVIHLELMNQRIGFTAFGLFQINANTFLSCLALIISYSVIIIQT